MPYNSENDSLTLSQVLIVIRNKCLRYIAKRFPLNAVRILALRMCGCKVGESVYIGEGLQITGILEKTNCKLKIGDRVAIAQQVTIILDSDPNWSRLAKTERIVRGSVCIEDDAWIGAGAIILPNITIEQCSIVGAGSVVTKNVPAYTVVVGNPARFLRKINNES